MGKKSGTQTVDQSPWGPTQDDLNFAINELNSAYGSYQPLGLSGPAAAEYQKLIQGDYLFSNPHLGEVINRASSDVNSQFAGSSRYGSGAHMDSLFTSAAAPIRYADYANERARQVAAVTNAPAFEYQIAGMPYQNISNYLQNLIPIARGGSQQTSPIYSNPLAGAVGGALAGASLAPAGATFGGSAATAGAAAIPAMWPYLLGGALVGGMIN